MPLKTSDEKQDLILKVFDYFEAELKQGRSFFKSINTQKEQNNSNSLLCFLLRSRKQGHTNEEKYMKRVKLDKLDNCDKELIKKTVFDLFNKIECVTLRKLKAVLANNCDLEISKYKLWKTLHELGFRYKKIIWEQNVV